MKNGGNSNTGGGGGKTGYRNPDWCLYCEQGFGPDKVRELGERVEVTHTDGKEEVEKALHRNCIPPFCIRNIRKAERKRILERYYLMG